MQQGQWQAIFLLPDPRWSYIQSAAHWMSIIQKSEGSYGKNKKSHSLYKKKRAALRKK
ncbi:hypothetical protein [Candidatus Kuenenia stuttgartiensis]|uniref:hypothetical protein n=1 Tax=Kuenenia stuttgartiensis TaxID=174633 RepID=UPI00146E646D|nr:hypothetical protein [Candidatus Kuenenia stuttgartiensis]